MYKIEGTGNLVFHNPTNLLSDCNPTSPFTREKWNLNPRDGMLVIRRKQVGSLT